MSSSLTDTHPGEPEAPLLIAPGAEHPFPPSPVRPALEDAALACGPAAGRLVQVLTADWPRSLQTRPAPLLRAAAATPAELDALLAAAGVLDLDELRDRAAAESGLRLTAPELRYTQRADTDGSGESRGLLRRLLVREQQNLSHTVDGLQRSGALELAAGAVLAGRRRFVLGDQKSAGYAALFVSDLSAALARVELVAPSAKDVVDALADARAGDVLVAFCFRRYSRLTVAAAAEFRAAGGVVVGITDTTDGPLAKSADHLLVVDTRSEAHADSPTTVVAVGHSLAALASAGAKGAGRRLARRSALARAFEVYTDAERHDERSAQQAAS